MIDSQKLGLVLVLALLGAGWGACRRQPAANNNATASTPTETMTPPPFATKEPAQYQANIVIETVAVDKQNAPLAPPGTTTQFVARNGDRRRLDYEPLPGVKAVIINTPEGDFLLLPTQKIYSVVKPEKPSSRKPSAAETAAAEESLESFSPEKLLNPQLPGARYENLGADTVNGRAATKYRNTVSVTLNQRTHTTETLLWVDDALGLPIKEEAVSSADGLRRTLEYRDIKTEVAATLFEIPKDYRQVSQQELQQRARPDAATLMSKDRDEAAHDETHLEQGP